MVRMMFDFYHNIAFSNFITSLEIYCLHLKEDGSETVTEEGQQCIFDTIPKASGFHYDAQAYGREDACTSSINTSMR